MDGNQLTKICADLFPLTRSITGDGVRETLKYVQDFIPLDAYEIPSGTKIFDWEIPLEWNLQRAFITGPDGDTIVDTDTNNLHLVSYSEPVDEEFSLDELQPHLHSLPDQPDLIPYRTAYYARSWGFCLSHSQRKSLKPGNYRVVIDSSLKPGALTYGEFFIPGISNSEYLITTHICHPSLANDNLSGISVATALAEHFQKRSAPLPFGLRFAFIPGTIGAIAWLAKNQSLLAKNLGTLVLSGIGDNGPLTYKQSKTGTGIFDRLFTNAVNEQGGTVRPFLPYGYDERQFSSPGINLQAGCLMRTPYGEYPEYHTSGDNLSILSADSLAESYDVCAQVIESALNEEIYENLSPLCEPQLGKRGLYDQVGGENQSKNAQLALLWLLSYSDGKTPLSRIAECSEIEIADLQSGAQRLVAANLLKPIG